MFIIFLGFIFSPVSYQVIQALREGLGKLIDLNRRLDLLDQKFKIDRGNRSLYSYIALL